MVATLCHLTSRCDSAAFFNLSNTSASKEEKVGPEVLFDAGAGGTAFIPTPLGSLILSINGLGCNAFAIQGEEPGALSSLSKSFDTIFKPLVTSRAANAGDVVVANWTMALFCFEPTRMISTTPTVSKISRKEDSV